MMAVAEIILNEDEFFADISDTRKESIDQHRKRKFLKGVMNKGKLLGDQKKNGHRKELIRSVNKL